jgi:hypothetical protein
MTATNEDPQPIRLIFEAADLSGWVYTHGQRMTDVLQAGEPFSFLPRGGDPSKWIEVLPDDTLLVVPPPHVSEPELRERGNQTAVEIRAGEYRITGTAHMRPGEQDYPMLRATRRFLPLTAATFGREGEAEEQADVVIVNQRRTSEFEVA